MLTPHPQAPDGGFCSLAGGSGPRLECVLSRGTWEDPGPDSDTGATFIPAEEDHPRWGDGEMGLHLPLLGRTCFSPTFAPSFVQGAEGVIVQAGPRVPWGPGEREYGAAHPPLVPTAAVRI